MEGPIERETTGALGGLFQQIINDMKNGMPLWEDLIAKATKLHTTLKTTILAVTAYLDAFQKIADVATNARGATREIGTALTRICLRHRAVETRMKSFTSAIMECLVIPLQEKLEDWRKIVLNLDKEHAKDYKRARAELKKRSTDTLRLQKKMRKGAGGDLQKRLEYGLQDVTERRQLLEEAEKQAARAALVEERNRFCVFVGMLKPVVEEEVSMLTELSRLQEVVVQLDKHTANPGTLPPASEQVIQDLKSSDSGWSFQTPPSSPSSLGSRKSSMCSISSLNSSSSGSSKSPSHPSHWHRSLSQPVGRSGTVRLTSVSSRDSGFTSQDTLYPRPPSQLSVAQVSNSSSSSTPCTPFPPSTTVPNSTATWPNLQETLQFERAASAIISDRPHTISSAYEKGHQRSALTVYTFQAPDQSISQPTSPVTSTTPTETNISLSQSPATSMKSLQAKPPLPTRCSSLERPSVPAKTIAGMTAVRVLPPTTATASSFADKQKAKPSYIQAHISKAMATPTYVNMHELANMASSKAQEMSLPPPPVEFTSDTSENDTTPTHQQAQDIYGSATLLRRSSIQGSKPSPPVRRTPSISTKNLKTTNAINTGGGLMGSDVMISGNITGVGGGGGAGMENLPPPPAFLLEPNKATSVGVNVAETIKALTEQRHTPASPNTIRRISASSQQAIYSSTSMLQQQTIYTNAQNYIYGTSPQQLKSFQVNSNSSDKQIYAQPSYYTTTSAALPATTSSLNKSRSTSIERNSSGVGVNTGSGDGPGVGGVGSHFMAALSHKLVPKLSPKNARRHSEDLAPMAMMGTTKAGLLDSLNAKLANQHLTNASYKASKIRQLINSRAQSDPKLCHESLMDQIKRGATLRRAKIINDRSAPKI